MSPSHRACPPARRAHRLVRALVALLALTWTARAVAAEEPPGRFVDPPERVVLGAAPDMALRLLPGAPRAAEVVFQVWSDATGSVEAALLDDTPPFVYPAEWLDRVPPGDAVVQAIVRGGDHRPVGIVSHRVRFVAGADPPAVPAPRGEIVWLEDFETRDYRRWSSNDYDDGWSECTRNGFSDERSVSGRFAHRSRITCVAGRGLHRGYGLLRFEGDECLPTLRSSDGGLEAPHGVIVSFWSWLDVSRPLGEGRWISLFTVTDDCSDEWRDVVTLGLQDRSMRLAPAHVDEWRWVPDAPSFPLRRWVRTTIYLNHAAGAMHVWQDGSKVCSASFRRAEASLCQWHFGLYASGDNEDVVLFEDDLRIVRLLEPLGDLRVEPAAGIRSRQEAPARPQAGTATEAVITVDAPSGPAPLAVHVHALDSVLGTGDALTARYEWRFGDRAAPFDGLEGFNAAHVYDRPGTYELTLVVTDERGGRDVATLPIEVLPPKRRLVHVAPAGRDANDGATPATAVRTLGRAARLVGDGTEVRLLRGGTYDLDAPLGIAARNVVVGAYGSGAAPILRWTGPARTVAAMVQLSGRAADIVLEDLSFAAPAPPTNESVRAVSAKGRRITVRRCRFAGVGTAIMAEGGGVDGLLTAGNVAGVVGAYFVWGEGRNHVHVGNTAAGSVEQHVMRFVAERVLVAHNSLASSRKSCIWLQAGRHGWIRGNELLDGPVQVGPIPQAGPAAARWKWAVVESNLLRDDAFKVFHGTEHVMLRNNVVAWDGGGAFDVLGISAEMRRGVSDVRIVHNTAVNHAESGRFLSVGRGVRGLVLANNMYVAPALKTGADATANVFVRDAGLDGFARIAGNLWTEPSVVGWGNGWHYCWPEWAHPEGYLDPSEWLATGRPADESYRRFSAEDLDAQFRPRFDAGRAAATPGVHSDRQGIPRPLTGTATPGAIELHGPWATSADP